jgi:hypothetical protein
VVISLRRVAVKYVLSMTIVMGAALTAVAQSAFSASPYFTPHPAVVRVVSPERDGTAYGSGALVAVSESFGLVVTNWHVVRDAAGQVGVIFPDGFRSAAIVLRTDRDWDLAALAVWRPKVQPIPVSNVAPQPGEMLTIAGYGSGNYRAIAGRCTQYISPGGNQPNEIVELDAPARNGDSGGPIFNSRGELAGVLFGTAFGRTSGSYCGRIRWFLASADGDFRRISPQGPMIAQKPSRDPTPVAAISGPNQASVPSGGQREVASKTSPLGREGADASEMCPLVEQGSVACKMTPSLPKASSTLPTASISGRAAVPPPSPLPTTDCIRTILAAIGVMALLYLALRLLGTAVG